MNGNDPIELMFGGLQKLGPGSDAETRRALSLLPAREWGLVVDAGCGSGRQTLVLAQEIDSIVHAVDNYQPFLDDLNRRAGALGIAGQIETHCFSMETIPEHFRQIDLLWSEGAAYSIGFGNALRCWASAIVSGGYLAVSELSWLEQPMNEREREFFAREYPDMRSVEENVALAEAAGYRLVESFVMPRETWWEGYYELLEPRARRLVAHADPEIRLFAEQTVEEVEVFKQSKGSYGYLFLLLQRR
ncbi:SAM-dependent methyltransferase [Candidatus Reidiella endopervernicosa]|uniref:Methyltransferase domain-containing protein n=1 Tax=Candidatus Reidiella endopervernicosa TaxID=2738883 RepID=A0A6N0HZ22_9GAMM|nr:class I SAM-dependent methyltransferase [Candidatus Reidiella endopervernicosa]QKQ27491.1 methyltransferase domain-containing protein [Candidatus Reidiella endopervernicosa]